MDLLNGQPVSVLSGNEFMPIEGKSFKQQVDEYFESQGRVAHSPFGDVILDMKGIKNDISHGIGRLKSSSFAAVKNVLERGVVINPMAQYHTNGKKNPTGMIAAPIQIGDEKYVCVVEVIANTQIQRLYVHEVTLTKNLQRVVADTTAVHGDVDPVTQPKGEIAKVLQNYLINKQKEDSTEKNQNIKTESRNMSRKNKIRLTESQLHKLIKECVRKTLQEGKKKDPMFQWFADFNKVSKFRETMDYIKKGGRNPLRKSKTNNIKEGRMLNEYEDYVGEIYDGEPLGEIKDGEVREFARKMFIHVNNEIRNLQRKYNDDYELCEDLQDIGELCMMAKCSL